MILVLLLGGGLGWMTHVIRKAHHQGEAVAAIERVGGLAWYDWQRKSRAPIRGRPWWRRWLESRLGVDIFSDVVRVDFLDVLSDAKLEMVGSLTELEEFNSDAKLEMVGNPSGPEEINTLEVPVTDAGLVHLRRLTRLNKLDLSNSEVTDAGLVHLRGLTGLRELDLSGTRITDAGLVHLEGLTGLQELGLRDTDVTEAGIVHLRKLTGLRFLDVFSTEIDDFAAQEHRRTLPRAKVYFSSIQAR